MSDIILREAGENYLEAILKLEREGKPVRSIDVAQELSVSKPSVNKAMGVLKNAGMVEQELYGSIRLTESGRYRAEQIERRHKLIHSFLTNVLGVSSDIADEDACKMEHIVSEQTMEKLVKFLEQSSK